MKYGGVHSCYCLPKDEIGINYFGSSEYLTKKEQKSNISNFKYIVIETFKSRPLAEMGEHKMLTENNAANSELWYNKCNGFKSGNFNMLGRKHSDESKKLISITQLNMSNETKTKLSESSKGKRKSENHKKNISVTMKGKKQIRVICPHCDKEGGISNMKRYHFDNCNRNVQLSNKI
jgi:hypothetical protein